MRVGRGARSLVENGVVADYGLVGEITNFSSSRGPSGYLRIRISVPVLDTPLLRRGPELEDNPDPFERAAHVIVAPESWANQCEQENVLGFGRGAIVPHAQVHEVRAGGPAYTKTTDWSHVFLDVPTAPGANPAALLGEIRGVVDGLGLGAPRRPATTGRAPWPTVIEALAAAHRETFAGDLGHTASRMLSTRRDTNAFNEAGIPAICYRAPAVAADIGGGLAGEKRPMAVDELMCWRRSTRSQRSACAGSTCSGHAMATKTRPKGVPTRPRVCH